MFRSFENRFGIDGRRGTGCKNVFVARELALDDELLNGITHGRVKEQQRSDERLSEIDEMVLSLQMDKLVKKNDAPLFFARPVFEPRRQENHGMQDSDQRWRFYFRGVTYRNRHVGQCYALG